jgi:hypothetical protein
MPIGPVEFAYQFLPKMWISKVPATPGKVKGTFFDELAKHIEEFASKELGEHLEVKEEFRVRRNPVLFIA